MLPLAFMFRRDGIFATYGHGEYSRAIEDFTKLLPAGMKDVHGALQDFASTLYWKTQPRGSEGYFLDKTPRYYLILPFLADVFPKAKFIFLFRNPIAVLSSILTTWKRDRFSIYSTYVDIFCGPDALSAGFNLLEQRSVAVNYEDLVRSPEAQLERICAYLGVRFDSSAISEYKRVRFAGAMGDPKGINEFDSISTEPLNKWKSVLNTRYRKWFSKRYVRSMGDNTLKTFGTSVKDLTQEIDSIRRLRRGSLQDAFFHFVCKTMLLGNFLHCAFNAMLVTDIEWYRKAFRLFANRKRYYPYL